MITFSILDAFVRNWWVLLIRGILAVLFAVMAFTLPDLTLVMLAALRRHLRVRLRADDDRAGVPVARIVAAGGEVCVSSEQFAPAASAISRS